MEKTGFEPLNNHKSNNGTSSETSDDAKKKTPVNLRLTGILSGERGSRTYAFKKYHKIANH